MFIFIIIELYLRCIIWELVFSEFIKNRMQWNIGMKDAVLSLLPLRVYKKLPLYHYLNFFFFLFSLSFLIIIENLNSVKYTMNV